MQKIGDIFSEIQEGASISNKQIYNLIEEFTRSPSNLINGLEQCYLKIIKLGSRSNKKPIERFEKITEKFFHLIYQEASNPKSRKKVELDSVYGLFQHVLNFLSNGFESPNLVVKQICAKHISLMLKVFSSQDIEEVLDSKVVSKLVDGTISLLRSKQPSLKLLALKIASYVQKFNSEDLKAELIRCMSNEESRDVRKVSLINLQVDETTLPHLLVRTREIDSELRLLVYKKLIKEKIHLANLKLGEIYKVVYDGLLAREEGVRNICAKYLRGVYENFKEKEEKESENGSGESSPNDKIDEEEPAEKEDKKKSLLANSDKRKELYNKTKIEVLRFLKIFQIEKTLVQPHLYEMLELVVQTMLHDLIPAEDMKNYLREFIKIEIKQQSFNNVKPEELFFFRVVCQYVPKTKEFSDLASIIEDDFLSLAEYTKVLEKCSKTKDLLSVYQLFLIADMMMNSDETGRQNLVAVIKGFCLDLDNELRLEDPEDVEEMSKDEFNDIYTRRSQDEIVLQQYSRSFFDTPIVQSKDDLVPVCISTLRKILDDTNNAFSNFILETIAEIKEPIEGSDENDSNELLNQKEKLTKKIDQCDEDLKEIEENLQNAKKKTRGGKKQGTNDETDKLERDLKKITNEKQSYQKMLDGLDDKINRSTIRCLHLACSLLQSCRISLSDPGIKGLLSSFIGPCFQNTTPIIKDLSFKCLSLYVLLDKRFCTEYMKIYKEYLDNYKGGQGCEPSLLTAIKAVFDFFLAYNLLNEDINFESNDEGTFDCQDLVDRLITLMFEGDVLTKKVCVEGFTRLLFNRRVKNTTEILTLLMIIWHDTLIVKSGGHEIIQILSMFFRTFTSYSGQGLEAFEKSLEHFVTLLVTLADSKELELNSDLVNYELNEDFVVGTVGNIGISILGGKVKEETGEKADIGDEFTPLEKFFLFLCEESSESGKNSRFFKKIFEKTISNFTIENLTPIKQNVLYRFLEHFCSQLSDTNKELFESFLKKLKDEEILADQSALEKISTNLDDENRSAKNDFRTFFKSLKDRGILAKKRSGGKPVVETRHESKDEEEEEEDKKEDEEEGDEDEEENENEDKGKGKAKGKAKGKDKDADEEEEEEEEEETAKVTTRGNKKGRKRKEPQKSKEEKEEEKEKENPKKVKRSGRRK